MYVHEHILVFTIDKVRKAQLKVHPTMLFVLVTKLDLKC